MPASQLFEIESLRIPPNYKSAPREFFALCLGDVPISGGWGYSLKDAIVINKNDPIVPKEQPFNGVALEYELATARIGLELVIHRYVDLDDVEDELEIERNPIKQTLIVEDHRHYDKLTYSVTCTTPTTTIRYLARVYFDITSFFGAVTP